MQFVIEKAAEVKSSAKIALCGIAGSGKTFTALTIAKALGDSVVVLDTENKSSVKYAGMFDFSVLAIPDYHPQTYINALEFVKDKGFDVVIVDSLSHAWAGKGGALELVDQASKKYKGNSYFAWGDVTPIQNNLVDAILSYPIHLISTMRMKMDYILTEQSGKQVPQKAGMGIVQRDSIEYEFDVVMELDIEHNLAVTKTRYFALDGYIANKPDSELGKLVANAVSTGNDKPVFPTGWYPTQPQFMSKVKSEFGFEPKELGTILKECGITEFDLERVPEMWNCLKAEFDRLSAEDDRILKEGSMPIDGEDARDMAGI